MAEDNKIEPKPEENKEIKVEAKKPVFKQEKPWERFKNSKNFKNFKSHSAAHMNRKTGGGG